jgi:hypothetical protein
LSLEDDRPDVVDGLVFPSNGLVPAGVFEVVRSAELGSSGGSPLIAMMKPSDLGHRDDPTQLRRFVGSSVGRILPERKMTPRAVVVVEVAGDMPPQRGLQTS